MRIEDNTQAMPGLLTGQVIDGVARKGSGDEADGGRQEVHARAAHEPEHQEDKAGGADPGDQLISESPLPPETELRFHVDKGSELIQVEFINQESGKTTQKIPSDAALKLHASLKKQVGVLMDRAL